MDDEGRPKYNDAGRKGGQIFGSYGGEFAYPPRFSCVNATFCTIFSHRMYTIVSRIDQSSLFLQSYYYDGMASITDEEFDLLKDELLWSGSKVAILSSDEKKFLEAQIAFNNGKPIMSNADFDCSQVKAQREQ